VAVLAVRRAQRNGLEVRLATSTHASDDVLAEAARRAHIPVSRGSESDVLERFVQATADLPDDAIVVRLTADNVFPDADFIDMMLEVFRRRNLAYLTSSSPDAGLPYGLAAELFACSVLREAAQKAVTSHEREHVTPWIRAAYGIEAVKCFDVPKRWERLRCTIDTLEDFSRVAEVFREAGGDPVSASWGALCGHLEMLHEAPRHRVPVHEVRGAMHSALVLGTAQLGMDYGRTNIDGCPSEAEAVQIIRKALEHGVTHLDTARAYGDSERRIGLALASSAHSSVKVVTKLDPLEALQPDANNANVRNAVDASVFRSCRELQMTRLDILLVHRTAHMDSHAGCVWARLRELRDEGVIGALGASVQNVDQASRAFANPDVQFLQLPFNVLDWRWLSPAFHARLWTRPDVTIHARSTLLQGILGAGNPALWPQIPGVNANRILSALGALAAHLGRRDVVDLCLAYVRGQEWIHGLVLGVETVEQLPHAVERLCASALTPAECGIVQQKLGEVPEALLNPAVWPPMPRKPEERL